ncbi:MAG: GntR family transcriptional regulator [Synergistaceae bacterium]|nr:GntR family transcriptional regulator [Synergistaceae bacterium]
MNNGINFTCYENVSDSVYHSIRELILLRKLKKGERVSEANLADQLGVSRTPVREALRRLMTDGYVVMKKNSGAWIAFPTPKDVQNAYGLRIYLERWAISIAAKNRTPLLLSRLAEKIAEETQIFEERNIGRYMDTNRKFHTTIAEASGNQFLAQHIDDIAKKTFVFSVFYEKFFDFDNNPSLEEHRAIFEAIGAGDEEGCIELITRHLTIPPENLIAP